MVPAVAVKVVAQYDLARTALLVRYETYGSRQNHRSKCAQLHSATSRLGSILHGLKMIDW
jgi:hypothetical protein